MNFNQLTNNIALITLVMYGVYALFAMGIASLILSSAIGLIAAAFFDRLEIITIIVVISGMIIGYLVKLQMQARKEGFMAGDAVDITDRVQAMMKVASSGGPRNIQGVYNPAVEGFAAAYNSNYARSGLSGLTEGFQDVAAPEGESASSSPATTERKNEVAINIGAPTPAEEKKEVAAVTAAVPAAGAPAGAPAPAAKKEEPFKSQAGLFKLGELPSETKEGPFVDAGSTLMKAIGALQPDQIKSMTEETQKMIDTQKNMISMLHSMRPVLQDGQQLLQSFSGIFGGGNLFKLGA
jgi:hypothetical protein